MPPTTEYSHNGVPYELAVTGEQAPFTLWLYINTAPGTKVNWDVPDPQFGSKNEAINAGHQVAKRVIDSNRAWKDDWAADDPS